MLSTAACRHHCSHSYHKAAVAAQQAFNAETVGSAITIVELSTLKPLVLGGELHVSAKCCEQSSVLSLAANGA